MMLGLLTTLTIVIGKVWGFESEYECPEEIRSTCIKCDINNKCVECKIGYYVTEGVCLSCMAGCVECEEASVCLTCAAGFTVFQSICQICEENCNQCAGDPNFCTECKEDYSLDAHNTCHYRFTIYIILASAIFVTCFICGLSLIVRKAIELRTHKTHYESVLDDESKRRGAQTVVSHVHEIGQTGDLCDLSVVESKKAAPTQNAFISNSFADAGQEDELIESLQSMEEPRKKKSILSPVNFTEKPKKNKKSLN